MRASLRTCPTSLVPPQSLQGPPLRWEAGHSGLPPEDWLSPTQCLPAKHTIKIVLVRTFNYSETSQMQTLLIQAPGKSIQGLTKNLIENTNQTQKIIITNQNENQSNLSYYPYYTPFNRSCQSNQYYEAQILELPQFYHLQPLWRNGGF